MNEEITIIERYIGVSVLKDVKTKNITHPNFFSLLFDPRKAIKLNEFALEIRRRVLYYFKVVLKFFNYLNQVDVI